MLRTLITAAVAGAFALPAAALASAAGDNIAVAQSGSDARFDALDRNRDGFISRDEAKDASELNTRFSELDRNNDDKLSREEYGALNASARGSTTSRKAGAQPEGGGTSNTKK